MSRSAPPITRLACLVAGEAALLSAGEGSDSTGEAASSQSDDAVRVLQINANAIKPA